MNKRHLKFRFWCEAGKAFVKDYNYSGPVDELFQEDKLLTPSQFTGMYDCNDREIYEGDIVEVLHNSKRGTVTFKFGAFCVSYDDPSTLSFAFMHGLPEVKIIGNKFEGINSENEHQS